MKYYLGRAKPLMDYQISTKKKKRKNPQKNIKSFPLIHLEVVSINSSFEGPALL
jgi:hypothetical protein